MFDYDIVKGSLMASPLLACADDLPCAVVFAYKTVIMFYHLERSTETTVVHNCRRAARITNNEILLSCRGKRRASINFVIEE